MNVIFDALPDAETLLRAGVTLNLVLMLLVLVVLQHRVGRIDRRLPTGGEFNAAVRATLERLVPILPGGDTQAVLRFVAGVAPGRPLAVFLAGEPPRLVARRDGGSADDEAVWIELHRSRLATGHTVQAECGTLVPALSRAGTLLAVVVVGGPEPVVLGAHEDAGVRVLGAMLARGLVASQAWPALDPERRA